MAVDVLAITSITCNIKRLRTEAVPKLSQERLGGCVGISGRHVWKIETMDGGHIPKAKTLFAIALALETTVDALYTVKAKTRRLREL